MATKSSRAKAMSPVVLFKILADMNRYKAVQLLVAARKGLLVSEIAEALSMGHSATSHLLASLNDAAIVEFNKEGRAVRYKMAKSPAAKSVSKLIRIK
jgi:DNA-binding transcriptional ArsR family regulator